MQPLGLDGIEPVTLAWQGTREDVHAVPALFAMRSRHIVEVCRAAKPRTRRGSGGSFYNRVVLQPLPLGTARQQ
jgi:hypothetical protein